MSSVSESQLQSFLRRIAAGDLAAREQLYGHIYEQLSRIYQRIRTQYADQVPNLDLGDVVSAVAMDVKTMLENVVVNDKKHLMNLLSEKIRLAILDMVKVLRRQREHEVLTPTGASSDVVNLDPPAESSADPARRAEKNELYSNLAQAVESLPDNERHVVNAHVFLELPFYEIADQLGLTVRQVKHLWNKAKKRLAQILEH
jgi:RNA polymerase sigma factor (sigma-70 family)